MIQKMLALLQMKNLFRSSAQLKLIDIKMISIGTMKNYFQLIKIQKNFKARVIQKSLRLCLNMGYH